LTSEAIEIMHTVQLSDPPAADDARFAPRPPAANPQSSAHLSVHKAPVPLIAFIRWLLGTKGIEGADEVAATGVAD
jgi:hypothetical protein